MTGGSQPHPADLSKQPSIGQATPPRMKQGELKNEAVLGESTYDPVDEQKSITRRMIDATSSAISAGLALNKRIYSSLYTQAMAAAMFTNRVAHTYVSTLEDQDLSRDRFGMGFDWSKKNRDLLTKHWNDEASKEARFNDLRIFEPVARTIYTAGKLQSALFKDFTLGTGLPQMAAKLAFGVGVGSNYKFQFPDALKRISATWNSEAALDFNQKYGDVLYNLPLQSLVDISNPIFLGIVGATKLPMMNAVRGAMGQLKPGMSLKDIGHVLEGHFEGGVLTDHLLVHIKDQLDNAGDAGRKMVEWVLHSPASGFNAPSIFSKLPMRKIRPVGSNMSLAETTLRMNRADMAADTAKRFKQSAEEFAPLREIVNTMDHQEMVEFLGTIASKENVASMAEMIASGKAPAVSPKVGRAFEEYRKIAGLDWQRRNKAWFDRYITRLDVADDILNKYRAGLLEAGDAATLKKLEGVSARTIRPEAPRAPEMPKIPAIAEPADVVTRKASRAEMLATDARLRNAGEIIRQRQIIQDEVKSGNLAAGKLMDEIAELRRLRQQQYRIAKMEPQFPRETKDEMIRKFDRQIAQKETELTNVRRQSSVRKLDAQDRIFELERKAEELRGKRVAPTPTAAEQPSAAIRPPTSEAEAFRRIDQLGLPPEDAKKLKKLFADAPAFLEDYYVRVVEDIQAGSLAPLDATRARLRSYLLEKDSEDTAKYLQRITKENPDKLREAAEQMLERVVSRDPSEAHELVIKRFINDTEQKITEIRSSKSSLFGGEDARERVLAGLHEMHQHAVDLATKTPKEQAAWLKTIDFVNASWKQAALFAPPFGYFLNNAADNTVKNFVHIGPDALARPNLNGVNGVDLGQYLSTKLGTERIGLAGDEVRGVMQYAPKFYQDWITRVNNATEYYTRTRGFSFAYHFAADEALRAIPGITKDDAHKVGLAAGEKFLAEVQYFNESNTEAMRWAQRVFGPFTRYAYENTAHWLKYAAEHPVAAATFMRAREKMMDASVDGTGMLTIPGTGFRVDPLSWSSTENAIAAMEHTRPLEAGNTAAETLVKIGRTMDSGAHALLRSNPFVDLAGQLLNGNFVAMLSSDVSDARGRVAAREFVYKMRGVLGAIDRDVKAATGLTVDQIAAKNGFMGPIAHSQFDRWLRNGANLMREAAAQNGETITREEGEQRFVERERKRTIGRLFGLDVDFDPNGKAAGIERIRSRYYSIPDAIGRQMYWDMFTGSDGKPLLEGVASPPYSIPDQHPDAAFLKEFGKATDNGKVQMFSSASPIQQRGIAENFIDWMKQHPLLRRSAVAGSPAPTPPYALLQDYGVYNSSTSAKGQIIKMPDLSGNPLAAIVGKVAFEQGVRAEPLIQQASLESDDMRSRLALEANNLFGTKADALWIRDGKPYISLPTTERKPDGTPFQVTAQFRRYDSPEESVRDHLDIVARRYPQAFAALKDGDAVVYATELSRTQDSGWPAYSTDPDYAKKLGARVPTSSLLPRLTAVPAVSSDGADFVFVPTKADDPLYREKLAMNKDLNMSWHTAEHLFAQLDSSKNLRLLMNSPTMRFFAQPGPNGKPIAWTMLLNASSRPATNPDGSVATRFGVPVKYPWAWYHDELMKSLADPNYVPYHIAKAEKEVADKFKTEIQPGLNRLRAAAYHPDSWNPLRVDREISESISSKEAGTLPDDFWQRVKDSGEYALMSDYAVSLLGAKAAPIYPLLHIHSSDGRIVLSETMVNGFLASGHEPELRLLAQSNTDLRDHLKSRGYPVEPGAVRDDALQLLSDSKHFDWNEKDVVNSVGVIPSGLLIAQPPSQEQVETERRVLGTPTISISATAGKIEEGAIPRTPLSLETRRPTIIDLPATVKQPPRLDPAKMIQASMSSFRSVSDFVMYSARETKRVNDAVKNAETIDGAPSGAYGRVNVFQTASHNVMQLPPDAAGRGAAAIMQLGHAVGFIGAEDLRVIYRGINQADLAGEGAAIANTVLALAGNTTATLTSAERYARLSQPTIRVPVATTIGPDGKPSVRYDTVANPDYNPTYAGISKYGGMAGGLLSMGSGFAAQAGAPMEVSTGLGAAGGVLQGASLGAGFGAPGIVIGAILGGALGGFMGSQRDEDREDRYAELRELQKSRLKQEIANAEERQQAFREDREARGIQSRERALNVSASRQAPTARNQLYNFLRRPTFASSQGLVRQVEGGSGRALTPRW